MQCGPLISGNLKVCRILSRRKGSLGGESTVSLKAAARGGARGNFQLPAALPGVWNFHPRTPHGVGRRGRKKGRRNGGTFDTFREPTELKLLSTVWGAITPGRNFIKPYFDMRRTFGIDPVSLMGMLRLNICCCSRRNGRQGTEI